jgi:hypothetical protein
MQHDRDLDAVFDKYQRDMDAAFAEYEQKVSAAIDEHARKKRWINSVFNRITWILAVVSVLSFAAYLLISRSLSG